MRRSICYCEPNSALAGEFNTWKFIYTTAEDLPKGTILRFDLKSEGREIDWEIPTTNLKEKANVIWGQIGQDSKPLQAKEIEIPDSFAPQFEFTLPKKIEVGETFTIVVGSPKLVQKQLIEKGTQAQTYSQRRRPFLLYIDKTGKRQFGDPEIFSMDIKGNILDHISILTPSLVTKNKRFDAIVRFEDEFGNLTSNAPSDSLIEVSYEQLRENLNWKIFVPETGYISLPNIYFNEEGTYTIQLKIAETNEIFRSAPICCFKENERGLYWGLLHGESTKVDSAENIENSIRHFRDEKSLNFFAVSPFEGQEETPNEIWKLINQNVAEFDEADRFTTFLGCQWEGKPKNEGLRQFIFSKDSKPILRKKESKYNSLSKIYKLFTPKEMMSIPSFTMGEGASFNFKEFNSQYERVVEIYNSWGSSECTKKEGNPRPIAGSGKKGINENAEGSILKALKENKRFGFVAGGLDDRGTYADFYENEQEQYSPGMTAILASEHTRTAFWEALYNRSCYATTGERIIIGLSIAGVPMGAETNTLEKYGLNINRHLRGYAAGTTQLQTIEIVRNGEVIKTFKPEDYHFDFEFDDLSPLEKITIDAKDKNPPFVFYYLRVTQNDGHMAWSSPIWIDYIPGKPVPKKAKSTKSTEKLVSLDDGDEDDLDEDF